ncbi:MAG: hypothetical protein CMO61_05440 [Verrucomicrobiales bacterium]|nr:hypothetical protein [Verrucomicrobiales bacterium]
MHFDVLQQEAQKIMNNSSMWRAIGIAGCLLLPARATAETVVFPLSEGRSGYIKESGENTHVGDGDNTIAGGEIQVGDTAFRKQIKGIVSFNTSSLPSNARVTSAVLRLRRSGVSGSNPFDAIGGAYADINLSGGFNGNLALRAGDFDARADAAEVATMSKPTSNGAWSEGTLEALGRRGINVDGHTQFRVYHIPDDNNNGESDYISYEAAELVVSYETTDAIARPSPLITPDDIHGLRTKWEKYFAGTNGATRATIQPEMRGLTHAQWAQAIERTGANGCTINIEARNNLLRSADFPLENLTAARISNGKFTPDQRNTAQMRFLLGLEEAREAGVILGSFRFHGHQRLYPNNDAAKEQHFVDDFAGFINCARSLRLDHWLRGIRLGENGISPDRLFYSMDLAKTWAEQINGKTDDWLKTHGLEMHGARMGLFFNDVDTQSNSGNFFQRISEQTGYFTWCFKFFNEEGIGQAMSDAGYDGSDVNDIKAYLRTQCGFSDLQNFVQAHRAAYPMHANCIFVGDAGDAMKQIGNAKLQALTQLFNEAGQGFRGIVAVNGYSWEDENGIGNQNKAIYKVEPTGSDPQLNPASYERWSAWPNIESGTADSVETADVQVGEAFTHAIAAEVNSGPAWLSASNGGFFGSPQAGDVGVNAFRIRDNAGLEKTLVIMVLDQLHIGDGQVSTRTVLDRNYVFEFTTNLNTWIPTGDAKAGDGALWSIPVDYDAPIRFFRMRISP